MVTLQEKKIRKINTQNLSIIIRQSLLDGFDHSLAFSLDLHLDIIFLLAAGLL